MATSATTPSTNGNGNGSAPESPPRIIFAQQAWTGTPRGMDDAILPDDYVWELLDVRQRMEALEEMGNDSEIATALGARLQEINAANWDVSSKDDSDLGREISDFVADNVLPHIENLIRWLGKAIQYGFAAVEPVFEYSDQPFVQSITRGKLTRPTRTTGKRQIYLRKCAHIRAQAVTAFKITEDGDLAFLHQRVWTGRDNIDRNILADKLLLRVYELEGADYYGKPPTRRLYGDWKFKTQLQKLNLLHHDRFAVGVPTFEEPPGGLVAADRERVLAYLRARRSGGDDAWTYPSGGKPGMLTASQEISGALLEWWKAYNLQIAKVFGTQQTELGSTETGSRAVGQTHDEQKQTAAQSDSENIANILNNGLIVPLVRWNYGEQQVYPTFAPSQRVRNRSGLAAELNTAKQAGVFHPQPADEKLFRDGLELAEVDDAELQKLFDQEQANRDAAAAALRQPGNGPASSSAGDQSGRPPAPQQPQGPQRVAASRDLPRASLLTAYETAAGGPTPAVKGQSSWRTVEYSEWEQRILQPDLLSTQLNLESSRTTAETHDVLRQIDEYLATQAEKVAQAGAEALQAFNPKVSPRLRQVLIDALEQAAERVKALGVNAVRREIRLQLGPSGVGPQRSPSIGAMLVRFGRTILLAQQQDAREIQLAAEVKRAAEEEIDRREQSTRGAISLALHQSEGLSIADLASVLSVALRSGLESLSTFRTEDNIQRVINRSFGIGRSEAAQQINDGGGGGRSGLVDANGDPIELTKKIYSAVMDMGTCDECAKWDGAEFEIDYPENVKGVQAPNPRCAGGSRCRCVWIYVTDKEAPPNVPASKGPLPRSAA